MYSLLIGIGILTLIICICIKIISIDKIKNYFQKEEIQETQINKPIKHINTQIGNETKNTQIPEDKISINISKDTLEKFFNTSEWNKDQRTNDIKNSLSFINFWLFIIAAALCIIAFCNLYDYYIKSEIIKATNETTNEIYNIIQQLH